MPAKAVSTDAGKSSHGGETRKAPPVVVEVEGAESDAVEEEEDSPAPVAEAESVARDEVPIGNASVESKSSSAERRS